MNEEKAKGRYSKYTFNINRKTNVDEIFEAVKRLYIEKKFEIFSRNDVRKELDLSTKEWESRYTGGFQGMIDNAPPITNKIRPKYRNVFTRIEKGKYKLTKYGLSLIKKID